MSYQQHNVVSMLTDSEYAWIANDQNQLTLGNITWRQVSLILQETLVFHPCWFDFCLVLIYRYFVLCLYYSCFVYQNSLCTLYVHLVFMSVFVFENNINLTYVLFHFNQKVFRFNTLDRHHRGWRCGRMSFKLDFCLKSLWLLFLLFTSFFLKFLCPFYCLCGIFCKMSKTTSVKLIYFIFKAVNNRKN